MGIAMQTGKVKLGFFYIFDDLNRRFKNNQSFLSHCYGRLWL